MWAMVVKEFRELQRDRRTVAMMVLLPVLLLVIFGYAASFNVHEVPTAVFGPRAPAAAASLRAPFHVVKVSAGSGEAAARADLRDGSAVAAVVTGAHGVKVLLDGTQLFSAQAARAALSRAALSHAALLPGSVRVSVLYDPGLATSWVMVPGLAGLILVFVGTLITSLGVVRERQTGTLEQLAVMPLRAWDVIAGKIVPYLLVAALDMVVVIAIGIGVFGVPFVGNVGSSSSARPCSSW